MDDGGDGSDVKGADAPVVPALGEDDYDVRGDEAKEMARGWHRGRPGAAIIPRQSWRRRRVASVDDERLKLGREKLRDLVKTMHK